MRTQCSLLPGVYGICVQLLLGAISFSALFLKFALFEKKYEGRSVNVFLRDIAKQGLAALWLHGLNLLSATYLLQFYSTIDSCDIYMISILIDTTIGVAINYSLLQLSQKVFCYQSGYYDNNLHQSLTPQYLPSSSPIERQPLIDEVVPFVVRMEEKNEPSPFLTESSVVEWRRQTLHWILIVSIMKIIVIGSLILNGSLQLISFKSLSFNPQLKLLLVMIFTPLVMNVFQYCITDHFVKA